MRRRWFLALLALLAGAVPGGFSAEAGGEEGNLLAGSRWVLKQLAVDGVSYPLVEKPETTIHFAVGGKLEGQAALNVYEGSYVSETSGELRWPMPFRATRRGGPAELLRLEAAYLNALRTVTRWEILSAGSKLRLSAKDDKTVLSFARAPRQG